MTPAKQQKMKDGKRFCSDCHTYRELHEYSPCPRSGYRSRCKSCESVRVRKYIAANREKVALAKRNTALKANYGITLDRYNEMLANQNGTCLICPATQANLTGRYRSLAVDHDRTCCSSSRSCGKCIRGLLCNTCNRAIGLFQDDVELLQKAINYLVAYTRKEKRD